MVKAVSEGRAASCFSCHQALLVVEAIELEGKVVIASRNQSGRKSGERASSAAVELSGRR